LAEVFSGAVLGYVLSLVSVWPISLGLVRARAHVPTLAKAIAPNINPLMLTVTVSLLLFTWGPLIGIILGILYRGAHHHLPGTGLGSPNLAYTLGVVSFALLVLGCVAYIWGRTPWWLVLGLVLWAGAFGWGLPYLSQAAPS
jgi:hypothetical protein